MPLKKKLKNNISLLQLTSGIISFSDLQTYLSSKIQFSKNIFQSRYNDRPICNISLRFIYVLFAWRNTVMLFEESWVKSTYITFSQTAPSGRCSKNLYLSRVTTTSRDFGFLKIEKNFCDPIRCSNYVSYGNLAWTIKCQCSIIHNMHLYI